MQHGPLETSGDRADIAAFWIERLTSGAASDRDVAELRAWIAADPLNRQAYEAARMAWAALPAIRLRRPVVRFAPLSAAFAATIAAVMIFLPASHDYETSRGQITEVRLPDGSIAWLDGSSAIDVHMKGNRRNVTVAGGRVAFKVARDSRPFSVDVQGATVTDLGTEFVVDRDRPLSVAVREGEVEVVKGAERARLNAGEGAQFDDNGSEPLPDIAGSFAWREGRIVFDRVPLDRALRELDRYYPDRIRFADNESMATRRVSGTLFTADPQTALETIARSQHLTLTRLPWITWVSPDNQ